MHQGFTALFTAEAAMDWAKMHFLTKHGASGIDNVKIFGLEGPLSNGRGDNFFTGVHIAACRKYHLDVDKVDAPLGSPSWTDSTDPFGARV